MGRNDIIVVDKLRTENKWLNLRKRDYADWVDRDELFNWLENPANASKITGVVHMGACSATTETDADFLMENNYGYSKKLFDDWAFKQEIAPKQWCGLKFFNVYGPQEYHKGRMASMVFHTFNQYKENGGVKLFKSYKEGFKDGEQLRDFVYLKDALDVIYFLLTNKVESGVYNIGTGEARSFLDLAMATMKAASHNPDLKQEDVVEFIPMPDDLRGKYQYFTQASMEKLRKAGYTKPFTKLEDGVMDYVQNYLAKEDQYL